MAIHQTFNKNNIRQIIVHDSEKEQSRVGKISGRISPDLLEEAEKICMEDGISKSSLCSQALTLLITFYPFHLDLIDRSAEIKAIISGSKS